MLCHGIYISHAISSSIELIWFLESDFILMMLFELCPPSVTWSCHRVKTFTVSALWYYPHKSLNGWYREWMCYRRYIFDVVNQSGFFFFKSWHSSTRLVLFHFSLIQTLFGPYRDSSQLLQHQLPFPYQNHSIFDSSFWVPW